MSFQRGNLNDAATRRTFPRMVGTLAHVGPLSVGRATLQPGWSGEEATFDPGDVFDIPPGHDAAASL